MLIVACVQKLVFPVFSSRVYVNKCLYNRKIMIVFELQKLVLYIA